MGSIKPFGQYLGDWSEKVMKLQRESMDKKISEQYIRT